MTRKNQTYLEKASKVLLAIGGAIYAQSIYKKYSKASTEDQAGENTPDGRAVSYAVLLYDAMKGGLFGWGTDEAEIKRVALLIKSENLHSKVLDKYRTLYNSSLVTDLQADGVYSLYFGIINGASTTPTPTGTTPPAGNKTGTTRTIKVNDVLTSYGGWVIRTATGDPVRNSIAGEKWIVVSWKSTTIAGTFGTWVMVKKSVGTPTTQYYWVFINGLYYV
jgi:hypothetical protein